MTNPYTSSGARTAFDGLGLNLGHPILEDSNDDDDEILVQIVVAQALFWAISLDDMLVHAYKSAYRPVRDGDLDGEVLDGARFARNAITHGAVVVHSYQHGLAFPLEFPLIWEGRRWRPLDEIEADWPTMRQQKHGMLDSYASHFPQRRPRSPLLNMYDWLEKAPDLGFSL